MEMEPGNMVLAAGAVGTAAFGIVEGLKWTPLGLAGFGQIREYLGVALMAALKVAYGPSTDQLLQAQYRKDRQGQTEIARTLRQGIRIGLNAENAAALANEVGTVEPAALAEAAAAVTSGAELSAAQRNVLGRFELAVDARIDSALSAAQDKYLGMVRVAASVIAIALSFAAAAALRQAVEPADYWLALVVGVAAVPLAPIANDVVGALKAATQALKARG